MSGKEKADKFDIGNVVAGGISFGNSVSNAARAFTTGDYTVVFELTVENYTNQHLATHQNKVHSGSISAAPVPVNPGMKEGLAGHKSDFTATGCVGTVSWKIGNTGKILVVMYSIPYSHDFHSNWCGAGIFDEQDTSGFYEKMYHGNEDGFKRKDFWNNLDPLEYSGDSTFAVRAAMGNSHKSSIEVQLYPKQRSMLAKSILDKENEGLGRK